MKNMRKQSYFILFLIFFVSCHFNELAGNVLSYSDRIGDELPKGENLSSNELRVLGQLCESFQRKSIGLSKEKSSDYYFYNEEKACNGDKKRSSKSKKIIKNKKGFFEFTAGKISSSSFKEVQTHEQGFIKEMCKELIFSLNTQNIKLKNFVEFKDKKMVIQVKRKTHDTIDLVVFHGSKKNRSGHYKVDRVDYMNFLSEPRGRYGEGTMLERSFIQECPFGSLEKMMNNATILEKVIH